MQGLKGIMALVASFTMFMLEIVNEEMIVLIFLMAIDMLTGVLLFLLKKENHYLCRINQT